MNETAVLLSAAYPSHAQVLSYVTALVRSGYGLVKMAVLVWMVAVLSPACAIAEIVRDGTVGPGPSIQPRGPNFRISERMGELRGRNLFHSFEAFNLTQDQSATFTGSSPIDNIIGRVTGGEVSVIDGLLRTTVPGADLYLMNPRGIVFGPNAALDVQGAFHASTASTLQFENGDVFSAVTDEAPILSVAHPDQFGFLGDAATIELQGSVLENVNGISLSAGSVELRDGAFISVYTDGAVAAGEIDIKATDLISLSGTDSEGLGSVVQSLTSGEGNGGSIRVEAPVIELRDGALVATIAKGSGAGGDLSVKASNRLTLSGVDGAGVGSEIHAATLGEGNGGSIHVEAPTIELRDGTLIRTIADGSGAGSDLSVKASNRLTLSGVGGAGVASIIQAKADGEGNGGSMRVEAPVIELQDGALIGSITTGAGDGGSVSVTATQLLTLSGHDNSVDMAAVAAVAATSEGSGNSGSLRITSPIIELKEGTFIRTSAYGSGSGGDLSIVASSRLTLSGVDNLGLPAQIEATSASEGSGGDIRIDAGSVELRDGADVRNGSYGTGSGGILHITAQERVVLSGLESSGSSALLQAGAFGDGGGGAIHISAPVIELRDGALVQSATDGSGNGGEVNLDASDRIVLSGRNAEGSPAGLNASTEGSGNGGTVHVTAPTVELLDGAAITTTTDGSGSGGTISIAASDRIVASGVDGFGLGILLSTRTAAAGAGGALHLSAPMISLTDGTTVTSSSKNTGDAGTISIDATDALYLAGKTTISTQAEIASGGGIIIDAGQLVYLNDSKITTNVTSGLGSGGNIVLSPAVVVLNESEITAKADAGHGGEIRIAADLVLASTDSIIDASAGPAGTNGKVVIHGPELNPTSKVLLPDTAFVDASTLLRPRCDARGAQPVGRFHMSRQQGLPLSPEDVLMAFDPLDTLPRDTVSSAPDPNVLAAAAFQGGRFEQAGDYWIQASERANHDGDAHAQGGALRGVAVSQQARGQYAESVQTLEAALKQAAAAQDKSGLIAAQGQLANAYMALGEMEAAEPLLREAIERAVAANEEGLAATLLNNLGNLHMVRQRYDEAVRAYTDGTHHAERAGDHVQRAKTLSNAARAVLEQGQPDAALAHLNEARTAAYALTPGHDKIAVLIHVAKTAERLSVAAPALERAALSAAYTVLREAAQLSREIGDARSLSYALGNLGRLYQREQRLAEALYLTRLAEQAAEDAGAPEALFRWHWQSGQVLWAQGEAEAALQSYRRAVAILEDSRQETLAQYGAAPVRFRQVVAPVYEDLVDALLQRAAQLGEEDVGVPLLLEARATVEQFRAAELRDYFRDECVIDLEAKNTRLEAVAKKVAVVYPIVLPERLELLVSLPGGLKRYTVPIESATLWSTVRRFRETVEMRDAEVRVRGAGRMLYEWLVQPFAQELDDVDTLVFVPGGALRTAPLAALYDGEDYLVRRFRVVVTPGLALTDPRPLKREGAQFVMAGLSVPVQDFPALPAVPRELEAVQQLYGGRILLDREFTSDRLKQSLARPVTVLHIASHAQFTGEDQSSFLLTYDGRLSMADLDRYLGVTRFRDQPLELLVLSACDTANGNERAALGLVGVGIKAGARSAMGSLWAIDDKAAAELVMAFYRGLKAPGVSKAEALQAAQWEMLGDRRYGHPYYWSAYVLVNNWL